MNRVAIQIDMCCKGVYLENLIPVQWKPNPGEVGIVRTKGNGERWNRKIKVVGGIYVEWLDNFTK